MLKSRIPKITGELAIAVDAAIVASAQRVAADAEQRLGPHRISGELEQQVHVQDRKREGVYVIAGDRRDPSFAFYAHMLEFGTTHSPPYPFLIPALEAHHEEIVAAVTAAVRRVT
jgi:HK97 gp10 family phage protein